jgi:hypothetical protein
VYIFWYSEKNTVYFLVFLKEHSIFSGTPKRRRCIFSGIPERTLYIFWYSEKNTLYIFWYSEKNTLYIFWYSEKNTLYIFWNSERTLCIFCSILKRTQRSGKWICFTIVRWRCGGTPSLGAVERATEWTTGLCANWETSEFKVQCIFVTDVNGWRFLILQ